MTMTQYVVRKQCASIAFETRTLSPASLQSGTRVTIMTDTRIRTSDVRACGISNAIASACINNMVIVNNVSYTVQDNYISRSNNMTGLIIDPIFQ